MLTYVVYLLHYVYTFYICIFVYTLIRLHTPLGIEYFVPAIEHDVDVKHDCVGPVWVFEQFMG